MYIVKWFIVPWVLFTLIFLIYVKYYMVKPMSLTPYNDLSNININELIELDQKRALSEKVKPKENFPKFYKGNDNVGILLIHGFTASPYEMSFLAEALNKKGYTVYNARVAGHGSNPENLNLLIYQDWYESLKYGYFILKKSCKKVVIIGQSMGALLAFEIAILNGVDSIIMLSPAIGIKDKKFYFVPFLQKFVNFVKKNDFDEKYKDYYYDVRPVKGLYQLYLLMEYVSKDVSKANFPTYIIQSVYDDIVDVKKVEDFYNRLKNKQKKIDLIKQNSIKHILTLNDSPFFEELVEKISSWINGG